MQEDSLFEFNSQVFVAIVNYTVKTKTAACRILANIMLYLVADFSPLFLQRKLKGVRLMTNNWDPDMAFASEEKPNYDSSLYAEYVIH